MPSVDEFGQDTTGVRVLLPGGPAETGPHLGGGEGLANTVQDPTGECPLLHSQG